MFDLTLKGPLMKGACTIKQREVTWLQYDISTIWLWTITLFFFFACARTLQIRLNLINWIIVEGSEHTELGYKQFMGEIFGDNILFSDGKYIYIFIIYDSDKSVLHITLHFLVCCFTSCSRIWRCHHCWWSVNIKMPPLLVKCKYKDATIAGEV